MELISQVKNQINEMLWGQIQEGSQITTFNFSGAQTMDASLKVQVLSQLDHQLIDTSLILNVPENSLYLRQVKTFSA